MDEVYQCENFSAETFREHNGYYVQADLMLPDGKFYRRARIAHCSNLPEAIRYARQRNMEVSVIRDSYLFNLIREYA